MKTLFKAIVYAVMLAAPLVAVAETLYVQGIVRDHSTQKPIPGARVSGSVAIIQVPGISQSDGSFVLALQNNSRVGATIGIFVKKDGYLGNNTVCPILSTPYICNIDLEVSSPKLRATEIETPQVLRGTSTVRHSQMHDLSVQIAGIDLEELKFAVVSSGKGRFAVNRVFLKLHGYADCNLGGYIQFAALSGTPAYWIHLSPEASEYDLFPQETAGTLSTWIYKDQDEGEFWVKLTGQKNRLYVITVEVIAQDLDHQTGVSKSSKPFKYFYASDGVTPDCKNLEKWYHPDLLKQASVGRYGDELDLLSYQVLTADFKYAQSLLDRIGAAKLHEIIPALKRTADFYINNKAFSENVATVARYVAAKSQFTTMETLFYQFGTIPNFEPAHDLPPVPEVIKKYTAGFVYKRFLAYNAYHDAEWGGGNWQQVLPAMDAAVAAARKSIITQDPDMQLARKDFPSLLYDAGCSYSQAGRIREAKSLLHEAIEVGYRDVENIRSDRDLKPLKQADPAAFADLLNEASKPR